MAKRRGQTSRVDRDDYRDTWDSRDLYFFEYRSALDHIEYSSDLLPKFVADIFPVPEAQLFLQDVSNVDRQSSLVSALPAPRRYDEVVFLGHSEGAVIIRQMFLHAVQPRGLAARASGNSMVEGHDPPKSTIPTLFGRLRFFPPQWEGINLAGSSALLSAFRVLET
jgi:hypothetical protein